MANAGPSYIVREGITSLNAGDDANRIVFSEPDMADTFSITAIPTVGGTAQFQVSLSPGTTSSAASNWSNQGAAFTANTTVSNVNGPVRQIRLNVTSGTWTIEVLRIKKNYVG